MVMGQTPFYRTLNQLEHHFSNIEQTRICSSIGDRTRTPYFGFERTKIESNRAFTRFIKFFIELTPISYFRTSNELEHVYIMVIEHEHPIFGLERTDIEHQT